MVRHWYQKCDTLTLQMRRPLFYLVKGVDNNFDVITIRNMIKSIFKSAFQHIRLRDSKKKFTISQNYLFGASHYDIHAAAPSFIDILY